LYENGTIVNQGRFTRMTERSAAEGVTYAKSSNPNRDRQKKAVIYNEVICIGVVDEWSNIFCFQQIALPVTYYQGGGFYDPSSGDGIFGGYDGGSGGAGLGDSDNDRNAVITEDSVQYILDKLYTMAGNHQTTATYVDLLLVIENVTSYSAGKTTLKLPDGSGRTIDLTGFSVGKLGKGVKTSGQQYTVDGGYASSYIFNVADTGTLAIGFYGSHEDIGDLSDCFRKIR